MDLGNIKTEKIEGSYTMDREETFRKEFASYIKRDGARKLLGWLLESDFFVAPASARYHSAFPGGLVEHSLRVFYRLRDLWMNEYGVEKLTEEIMESLAICGLLHDICKANFYTISMRNVKNDETGKWEKKPYYEVQDILPYGHGEKSVYILRSFIPLKEEEAMAIRWHMGAFDDSAKGHALSQAFRSYPLALMLHLADMQANYLDEMEGVQAINGNGEIS